MVTALQTIQTLVRSLDRSTANNGITALDAAIRACSGYSSTRELVNEFVYKCRAMQVQNDNSVLMRFLKEQCGIDVSKDNTDTGAISGYDAGSSSEPKTAETIVYEPSYQIGTFFEYTKPGVTYNFLDKNKRYVVTAQLPQLVYNTDHENDVILGLKNWWITSAANLVKDTYGLYFNKRQDASDRRTVRIVFFLYYDQNDTAWARTYGGNKHNPTGVSIGINMSNIPNVTLSQGTNVSGYSGKSLTYMDRLIAHEMTHAMFMLNVSAKIHNTLPQFFREGISELVHGADDTRGGTIKALLQDNSRLSAALDINNHGTLENDAYAAGYMLLRYLAKQVSSGIKPPIFKGLNHSEENTVLTATAAYKGTYIDTYHRDVKTIDARKVNRAINIDGNNNANTIYAGTKGGILRGRYGNDILYGGAGVDTFFAYGDEGDDTFYDYQSARDLISLGATKYGALTSASVVGNDVVLKVGKASLTVKDAIGKYIKIKDGYGNISYTRFIKGTASYNSNTASFDTANGNAYTLYQKAPTGLAYNGAKTSLTATAKNPFTGTEINANMFWWTLKSINISAAAQSITVRGSAALTSMTGSRYDDNLFADETSRTVTIKGGNGNDAIAGASVSSKLYGGNGDDTIRGRAGTSYLYGEAGDDKLFGGEGKNYLYGGAGADTLMGGKGYNRLDGGAGNDYLFSEEGDNNYLYGGAGDDSLSGGEGYNRLEGGAGNDYLTGGTGSETKNYLYGGAGNDSLIGGEGYNRLDGGEGNDYLVGGTGSETKNDLYGGNGDDKLYGGANYNLLDGGNGNDELYGGEGTNELKGGAGNDLLIGGAKADINNLYGGAGHDALQGGSGVNNLYGGAGNDQLVGGSGTNLLKGEAGNDVIKGGSGENTLWGGAGKDTLTGGTGKNTFYFASLGEMSGDTITNLKGSDNLYFNVKQAALDLDAIYQNYDLGKTSGKNTISLTGETLTLTDKGNRKYTMTLAGGYTGSINLENSSGQRKSFKL